ncbi:hypothetical protein AB834_04005 [PVC group bacterium (ex Bugula neritina AB1)]|nr:hypothetical protein AB834_04005 [PVC group bacterium (ex Bugula neritina AB1)]
MFFIRLSVELYKEDIKIMIKRYLFYVEDDVADFQRLDQYLSLKPSLELSRSSVQKLIQSESVQVNGAVKKARYTVKVGDAITVQVQRVVRDDLKGENIPLNILYEDSDIFVLNKEAGMVVHPACGHYSGTLVHALLYHSEQLSKLNGDSRPGIIHRLDKDTSGLMIVAKNDKAHRYLAKQLERRFLSRKYLVLVCGDFPYEHLKVETGIARSSKNRKMMDVVHDGGRKAITHFLKLKSFSRMTLLEARLLTGRTHQIRVHLKHLGYPVFGDPVYRAQRSFDTYQGFSLKRQALHAYFLKFIHPSSKEVMFFKTDPPEDMLSFLAK